MGTHCQLSTDPHDLNTFMCHLINDIKAFDHMLAKNLFETGPQRIGAEQELCLVDKSWRPAPLALSALEGIDDPHFTTEHSQYNLEINLDPILFGAGCLTQLENDLNSKIAKLDKWLEGRGAAVLLGILPTIRRSDLSLDNLTPLERYHLLNEALNDLRGGHYEFRIEGVDELITHHNSIMFEGCNTSFQIHLQIDPADAVAAYNWAQAIAGPVLAAGVCSPMLLGKRLWQETRIALFQQSVDTRRPATDDLRRKHSRITFGHRWLKHSAMELFQEDLANYRVLVAAEVQTNPLERLAQNQIPRLEALALHNGTVYRWNRICYGITGQKPHLRIENRILPAGPTVVDQVANSAFWFGLMNSRTPQDRDVASRLDFAEARLNFVKAARDGLGTCFNWLDGTVATASDLILDDLLPAAYKGLERAGIPQTERERYLGIIEERVSSGRTGSHWIIENHTKLARTNEDYEASVAITAGSLARRKKGDPVHLWSNVAIEEAGAWVNRYWKVEQIMTTDFFSVRKTDPLYFAGNLMAWFRLRHVPVEDDVGNLVGLLTQGRVLERFSTSITSELKTGSVEEVMIKEPHSASPEDLSVEALAKMRRYQIGCLPVVKDGKLVGLLIERNFMNFSEHTIRTLRNESDAHLQNAGDLPS